MQKFRRKPVIIEAVHFNNPDQVVDGVCNSCWQLINVPHIHTLEGMIKITLGDWIIKGIHGELYTCKPDIFEKEYDRLVMNWEDK